MLHHFTFENIHLVYEREKGREREIIDGGGSRVWVRIPAKEKGSNAVGTAARDKEKIDKRREGTSCGKGKQGKGRGIHRRKFVRRRQKFRPVSIDGAIVPFPSKNWVKQSSNGCERFTRFLYQFLMVLCRFYLRFRADD